MIMRSIVALLVLVAAQPLLAHEGIDEQLADVTARIEQHPHDAALYLQRAELHRLHQEWTDAQRDYDRAHQEGAEVATIDAARAQMYLESGDPGSALQCVDGLPLLSPHSELVRARALRDLGRIDEAVDQFALLLTRGGEHSLDTLFELVGLLEEAGRSDQAVAWLDSTTARDGAVPAIELRALELETKMNDVDAALRRIDRIAASSPRHDLWQLRKIELLERADRRTEAAQVYAAVQQSYERLDASARESRIGRDLKRRLDELAASDR